MVVIISVTIIFFPLIQASSVILSPYITLVGGCAKIGDRCCCLRGIFSIVTAEMILRFFMTLSGGLCPLINSLANIGANKPLTLIKHYSQIILGAGMALSSRFLIPFPGPCEILSHPFALLVHNR